MNLPFLLARRYFISPKSTNAINVIAGVSVVGMMVGTMALILVLSVFNGFEDLVISLYNSFNPDLKIEAKQGKTFTVDAQKLQQLRQIKGIKAVSAVLEENALLRYHDNDVIGRLKGVDSSFLSVSAMDSTIVDGSFLLEKDSINFAVVGLGIQALLGVNVNNQFARLEVYVPQRAGKVSVTTAENAFRREIIYPIGVYAIQQDFDAKYTLVPLRFMQQILEYPSSEVSALEVSVQKGYAVADVQAALQTALGKDFRIMDRYQQDEFLYKIMRTEKWAVYLILTFILIIAAFNIVGSLSMLVIEKQHDLGILKAMGASSSFIQRIFFYEGLLLSLVGAAIGMILATLICWAQQHYKLLSLNGDTFLIDAYPVSMRTGDFVLISLTVVAIALVAAYLPARRAAMSAVLLQKE